MQLCVAQAHFAFQTSRQSVPRCGAVLRCYSISFPTKPEQTEMEDFTMTTINLKDFYYWHTQDQFIEISDEVAAVFLDDARYEMAYQRRLSRHKAQYSLDCDDGIEYSACLHEPTPQELLERMEMFCRLWNALNSLPEVQGRRIDAHIILGKSIKEIAEAEGVHEESIRQSIKRGLERMKKTF